METSKTAGRCSPKHSSEPPGIHDWVAPVGVPFGAVSEYIAAVEKLWRENIKFVPQPLYLQGYSKKCLYYGPVTVYDDRVPHPIILESV